jgi:hypothetical protein
MVHAHRLLLLGSFTALLVGACGVGDDDGTTPPPFTEDPRLCTANFTIAGSFTLGMAPPDDVNNDTGEPPGDGQPDIMGCWPTGTWTWTVAAADTTCATAPTPEASYSFRTDYVVTDGDPGYAYTLVAPALTSNFRLKVSSGGGGLCEGGLEIFSADGKESWNLQPALDVFNASGPLTGVAEYALWKESQTP